MRFETSHITSTTIKQNVITQLNRVDNDLAIRVAAAIGVPGPAAPDPTYYNDNSTSFVSIFNYSLPTIRGLNVGILASTASPTSMAQANSLAAMLSGNATGLNAIIVAEVLQGAVNQTYSAADASGFDGVIVTTGAQALFTTTTNTTASSTYYPAGRPMQILLDAYRWGKPVGVLGTANPTVLSNAAIPSGPGVYAQAPNTNLTSLASFVSAFEGGLSTFRFVNRFPIDP
jgi:catalase